MRWWALLKQFPKFVLVAGIIVGSTALFIAWWFFHSHARPGKSPQEIAAEQAAIRQRAAMAEARIDYLFLADSDLYDAGTGELLFRNWLKGDAPLRLFYDQKGKKLYGQYDRGFARYVFDGTREATMMEKNPLGFFDDSKKIVFVRNKNIWVADIDWQSFQFINERQITNIDSFYENHFAENLLLLTSKTLLVRNLNNLLRVNLETGNVKPTRIPLGDIGKRRSPDSKWVVGVLNGQFYCYDVDADSAKTIPVGRTGISDFLWLGNDRCLGLAAGKEIVSYDRAANVLTAVTALPFPCFRIGEPSPGGRYIFAAGGFEGRSGVLVDLQNRTAAKVNGGAGVVWVNADTFAYSREVPASDLRGTWLQTVGESEQRVSLEPYLVSGASASLLASSSSGLVILETRHGLTRMKRNGSSVFDLVKLTHPVTSLRRLEDWGSNSPVFH